MAWLLTFFKGIGGIFLPIILDWILARFKKEQANEKQLEDAKKKDEEAAKEALEDLKEAGKNPALSPEEKEAALEKAFDKFRDDIKR